MDTPSLSFEDNRDARIAYANEPTELHKRTHPVSTSKLFTAETARALLSLIPFVGAIADLVEGNIEAGVKGFLIDLGSFLLTGGAAGAKTFAKGLKMLIPFSGKPFSMQGLKGGGSFIRGLFNPLENIPDLLRSGQNGVKALKNVAKWSPVHIGSNVYLPIKAFEQWRWTLGAWGMPSADPSQSEDNLWPGARKGLSGAVRCLRCRRMAPGMRSIPSATNLKGRRWRTLPLMFERRGVRPPLRAARTPRR